MLNHIIPVPSQRLDTIYHDQVVPITLDSGATISFIRLSLVKELTLPIQPNGQLATLADETTRLSAVGEVDIIVNFHNHPLRLRALVVEKLQALCFGGTNFHVDNRIKSNISEGTVEIGQMIFSQSNAFVKYPSYPPKQHNELQLQTHARSLIVKQKNYILPDNIL